MPRPSTVFRPDLDAGRWAIYVCRDRRGCPRRTFFDLYHEHGWTTSMMEEALRKSGWTYRPGTTFSFNEPHGWRCPDHPHVVAAPGLEPGNPAV